MGRSVDLSIGSYATFHVRLLRPVASVDWVIMAKDIIVNQGTEVAGSQTYFHYYYFLYGTLLMLPFI